MTTTRLHVAVLTHRGVVREQNEDCAAVGRMVSSASMTAPALQVFDGDGPLLCMIADGLGGHTAGEIASQHACQRMVELTSVARTTEESLRDVIIRVHFELYEMMKSDERHAGMGTTIAGILFQKESCLCFNVGDSRVWRVQSEYLAQLSTDDIAIGRQAGAITQCLGGTSTPVEILPHIIDEKISAGRSYVICSDGLTDMLTLEEIEARLSDDPGSTVQTLFEAAMDRGAKDNISIIYARCV